MTSSSRWLGIIALILIPASASSLGLGDITLNSYLNERLDAQIAVSVSGPDELNSLRVEVASRDVFERFGIDRADMLDKLRFTVESGPGGQAVVRITSPDPVVEPFLTFLIEARSSGGRLLREYTVLLDPPLFLPEPEQVEAPSAAPIQPAPSAGAIARPRQEPARQETRPAAVAAPTTYGPVRRNETLWGIAEQVRPDPGLSMNQVMISLFQANPDAFDGNINRLRAGARLQVPDFSGMSRLSRAEAAAEVRRHNTDWRRAAETRAVPEPGQAAAAPVEEPEPSRLKLVPPSREPEAVAGQGASASADNAAEYRAEQEALNEELLAAVQSLRRELEETRQEISLKDGEIAALQDRLAGLEEGRAEVPAGETGAGQAVETATEPATTPAAPVKAEPPAPPPAKLAEPEDEGGIFSSMWTWLLIVIVALAAGAVVWRRRQESQPDEGYESWASTAGRGAAPSAVAAGSSATATAIEDVQAEPDEFEPFEDSEEEAPVEPEPAPRPEPEPARKPAVKPADDDTPDTTGEYAYPFEDTIAGATGINLEQSDPLAEADFHMAYGLYDQAADLIQKAVEREPDRMDLRMKLLDILFVWGKQDEFLQEATELQSRIGGAASSDWERVAIMGRQICPDAELFTGGPAEGEGGAPSESGASDAADLDFDLGPESGRGGESDSIDFDVGSTGEIPMVKMGEATPSPDATAELEIEELGLDVDLPLGEGDREDEQPSAAEAEETSKTEVLDRPDEPEDETGQTEVMEADAAEAEEETGLTEVMEGEPEEETGLTEVLNRVDQAADDETAVIRAEDLDIEDLESAGETKELPALDVAAVTDEDTGEIEALSEDDLDLDDLTASYDDDLDKTAEIPIAGQGPDADTLIEEIFGDDDETKIAPIGRADDMEPTREMPEVKPSDVTLSEVGTKLDLARAYMDMGDPDGARSILEEVIDEGDDAQQKEARQLLDGLS